MSVPIRRYNVGLLVFDNVAVLDFTGPIDIFSHVLVNKNPDNPDRIYKCLTIGRTSSIRAADSLAVHTDLLIDDAMSNLDQFDILVVPGAPPAVMAPLLQKESPEMKLVSDFAKLPPKSPEAGPRILFSVCVGGFFLGAAGILRGLNVSTHHRAQERLRQICREAGGEPASIVNKRFVDGGVSKFGPVSVITSGGISSCLDAALYIVRTQISEDMEAFIKRVMEYESGARE